MGLDLLEIFLAVEEKFGISISDEEAQQTRTPGQLTDLVLKKIRAEGESVCMTRRAFYLLRRHAMQNLNVPRSVIRIDTALTIIIPNEQRREVWAEWGRAVGALEWPQLVRPRQLVNALALAIALLLVGSALYVTSTSGSTLVGSLAGTALALLTIWPAAVLTRPFRVSFPQGCARVGELAQFIVARNPQLIEAGPAQWTRERVRCVVRDILIEQTGIADFREDSDFIKDMKID